MIGMSDEAKERYMRGEYQYARLTMERSPYEPYKGEVYNVPFTYEGQNIFTRENETDGKFINSSGGESSSSSYAISDYLEVEPNKRYVFDAPQTSNVFHAFYNESKEQLAVTLAVQEMFFSPPNAKYVRLSYRKSYPPTDFHSSIGTVPHGTLDVKTGVLTVDYAYISDLSNYSFGAQSEALGFIFRVPYPMSNFKNTATAMERLEGILCSAYKISSTTGVNANFTPYAFLRNANRLYFRNDDYTGDATAFRSSVSGVQAIYELENPCVYQLTPEEVTTLLNENNIWADSGNVSVTYSTTAGTQKTESGSLVHITDGANNIPVTSLTAAIKYKQDLHGYDYPWVGGGGKNICPNIATYNDTEINGVRVTVNADGSIYIKGTATANVAFNITDEEHPLSLKGMTTYTISGCPSGGAANKYMLRLTSSPTGSSQVTADSGSGQNYTPSEDANFGVRVIVWSGQTVDFTFYPMVRATTGTTAEYEPYENICPITGFDAVTVTRTQTNTFNANNFVLQSGSGLTIEDANTILMEATSGMENKNEYPLIKGYARTLKFVSESIRTVGMTETWEVYQRVNGVLSSIAHIEQSTGKETVVASVSADADAIVFGGWSGTNTVCELQDIRLDIGAIPANLVMENADIVDGGYSINRYVVTGDSLQFGSCVSGELTLILDNHDGRFNDESFMSKEIHAEVGVKDENDIIQYSSLGYFTIDESPKKLSTISLAALDRMMKFEKKVDATLLSFPVTLYELLARICEICDVDLGTSSYNFLHANYNVMEFPAIAQTYRDILSYICEINGSCAYMDWYGRLRLGWFSNQPSVTLDTSNRFDSDIDENAVIIYGVSVITETESYHAGTVGFDIQIGHNPLITYDEQEIADDLLQKVGGFTYFPFKATTMPMPFLFPMDGATFIDKDGNSHFVAITDITFRLNRNTALGGRGQTVRETDYQRKYGVSATYANVDEALEIIKNSIIKNAEFVNERMDQIVQYFTGMLEAQSSEYGAFKQETNAKITQNAEGLTQAYTNIQQIDSKYGLAITETNDVIVQLADGAVAMNTNFRSVTEAYIKSGLLFYENLTPVYGVAVGQLTYEVINGEKLIKRKGVYSVFTAEELAFYVDDVKVAYMKNNKLYINNAQFLDSVTIGSFTLADTGNGFVIK